MPPISSRMSQTGIVGWDRIPLRSWSPFALRSCSCTPAGILAPSWPSASRELAPETSSSLWCDRPLKPTSRASLRTCTYLTSHHGMHPNPTICRHFDSKLHSHSPINPCTDLSSSPHTPLLACVHSSDSPVTRRPPGCSPFKAHLQPLPWLIRAFPGVMLLIPHAVALQVADNWRRASCNFEVSKLRWRSCLRRPSTPRVPIDIYLSTAPPQLRPFQ